MQRNTSEITTIGVVFSKIIDDFDAEKAVWNDRRVMEQRDAATTPEGTAEFETIALRMRKAWKDWQGEDSLDEMAFGKPCD